MHIEAQSTEDRIVTLIAKGLRVSLDIDSQEDTARVKFSIGQGSPTAYGGRGFLIVEEASGAEGVRLLRAALAAAEAFMGGPQSVIEVLPVHLPRASTDTLRTAHRRENADVAQALDQQAVRELEPHL